MDFIFRPLIGNETLPAQNSPYIEEIRGHEDRRQGPLAFFFRVALCIWNFVMLSIGIGIIILSSWALLKLRLDIIKDPISLTSDPLFLSIVAGCLITLISIQGAFGFFRGNTLMLSGNILKPRNKEIKNQSVKIIKIIMPLIILI